MALNTKQERASMLNFGGATTDLLPPPDGLVDSSDRLQLLGLYSGIPADSPSLASANISNIPFQAIMRRMRVNRAR